MSTTRAIEVLKDLAPDITKNGFFPGKTEEEIKEMGKAAGQRILKALKSVDCMSTIQ